MVLGHHDSSDDFIADAVSSHVCVFVAWISFIRYDIHYNAGEYLIEYKDPSDLFVALVNASGDEWSRCDTDLING